MPRVWLLLLLWRWLFLSLRRRGFSNDNYVKDPDELSTDRAAQNSNHGMFRNINLQNALSLVNHFLKSSEFKIKFIWDLKSKIIRFPILNKNLIVNHRRYRFSCEYFGHPLNKRWMCRSNYKWFKSWLSPSNLILFLNWHTLLCKWPLGSLNRISGWLIQTSRITTEGTIVRRHSFVVWLLVNPEVWTVR